VRLAIKAKNQKTTRGRGEKKKKRNHSQQLNGSKSNKPAKKRGDKVVIPRRNKRPEKILRRGRKNSKTKKKIVP